MIHKTLPTILRRFFLFIWLAGFGGGLCLGINAQVLTNRTPDKAKIQSEAKPKPSPSPDDSLLTPDPLLLPPGTARPRIPARDVTPA